MTDTHLADSLWPKYDYQVHLQVLRSSRVGDCFTVCVPIPQHGDFLITVDTCLQLFISASSSIPLEGISHSDIKRTIVKAGPDCFVGVYKHKAAQVRRRIFRQPQRHVAPCGNVFREQELFTYPGKGGIALIPCSTLTE